MFQQIPISFQQKEKSKPMSYFFFFKKGCVSLGKDCGQELICLTGFLEGSIHSSFFNETFIDLFNSKGM